MRAALSVLALLLAGCDGRLMPRDACTERIDAIAERLDQAARVADPSGAPAEIALPSARGGVPLEGAPALLVVSDDEVRLGGRVLGGDGDVEPLAARVASDLRMLAETEDATERAWTVALWVEPDHRAERLVALLSSAPPNVRFALLHRGVDRRAPRAPGAPAWVRQAVRMRASADARERRERLEAAWARATEACVPAQTHLPMPAGLAAVGPPMGAPSVGALVDALRRCGCEGQVPSAIEAVALAALVSREGALVREPHALRFGPAVGEGRELAVGPEDTTSELLARLAALPNDSLVWIHID